MHRTMPAIQQVVKLTIHNRRDINGSTEVGCVYCLRRYKPDEIKEWTDCGEDGCGDTAICPHCSVDAVLPGVVAPYMDEAYLRKAHDYWFKPAPRPGRLRSGQSGPGRA